MAISTYKVFLMKKADTGEQWSKLIDIKEFPDLGGEPEMLETTTLHRRYPVPRRSVLHRQLHAG